MVATVDVGDFPLAVVADVWVEGGGDVVRVEVFAVVSVVEELAEVVVVVTGGPGLFARTELGEKGGCVFGLLSPNIHASTLPAGGS